MSDSRRSKMSPQDTAPEGFVDLGLSVYWAKGNICKDSNGNYYIGEPIDRGCYYSWGNIEGHNYQYYGSYYFDETTYASTEGASLIWSIPSDDSAHDAALACLGTGKRMPTAADFNELINNCTATWVTINHTGGGYTRGRLFKSNIAGYTNQEIFIPASGYYENDNCYSSASSGQYWSSSASWSDSIRYLNFSSSSIKINYGSGYYGRTVRAVMDK